MCKERRPVWPDLEAGTAVTKGSGLKDMKNQRGKKTKSPVGISKSNTNIKPDLSDSSFQERIS